MNRAFLVGINAYPGQPLFGCVNDVNEMATYFDAAGFSSDAIELLRDDEATKAAIADRLAKIIASSRSGDHIYFHFSGHGTQMSTNDTDEPDGVDEVLCPVDFDWSDEKALKDNELAALFGRLPDGVALTFTIDACHSGDLKRVPGRRPRFLRPEGYVPGRQRAFVRRLRDAVDGMSVLFVSACQSNETAADADFGGVPQGAFTFYWLRALRGAESGASMRELVEVVGRDLDAGSYGMHPTLEGPSAAIEAPYLIEAEGPTQEPADPALRTYLAEMLWLGRADREFGARLQASGIPTTARPEELEQLVRGLRTRDVRRRGIDVRPSWWGVDVQIDHDTLQTLVPGASLVLTAVGVFAGAVSPLLDAIARYIVDGLGGLRMMDEGAGVVISAGLFNGAPIVARPVPVRSVRARMMIDNPFPMEEPEGGGLVRA